MGATRARETRINGKRLDPLVQGTAMLDALEPVEAEALLDGVAARGARSFDLAHHYGGGEAERRFGAWLKRRGRADDLILIGKGAHPDPVTGRRRVTAEDLAEDVHASLQRLGIDAFDLYLLHRDDEDVPVSTVIELLHELREAGLVRAYGASNWRHERVEAANAYAREHGRDPLSVSSPHFSLAVPREPPWPGTVSIAGPDAAPARDFYSRADVAVLAWSSLAMGYFALDADADANAPIGREQTLGARVFDTPANAARRERARAIAREDGDSATTVALRYVLGQPLRIHPIVGCRTVEEYAALRDAAERPLDAERVRWLEQGEEVSRGP